TAAAATASSCADSKAIAVSTAGSPKVLAQPNASRPARRPTMKPRKTSRPTMFCASGALALVAGKTQQMTCVMDELMHAHAIEDRGGTLFGTHEVHGDSHDDDTEDGPGHDLCDGNG